MLIYSMSVSVHGFIADREGVVGGLPQTSRVGMRTATTGARRVAPRCLLVLGASGLTFGLKGRRLPSREPPPRPDFARREGQRDRRRDRNPADIGASRIAGRGDRCLADTRLHFFHSIALACRNPRV